MIPLEHLHKLIPRNLLQVRSVLARALKECGRGDEASEVFRCRWYFRNLISVCGTHRLVPVCCDHPLCPLCARDRSIPLQRKVLARTRRKDRRYRFLTLTRANVPEITREYVRSLAKLFSKLRRAPFWKEWITGGVYALDTTYNRETRTWHVHMHVIIEARGWLPDDWVFQVRDEWRRLTGDSHVVHMRAVNKRAVKELVKYQAKAATFVFRPALVDEYLRAFANARRIQTFGSFHGKTEEESASEQQAKQLSFWGCKCGACRPKDWQEIGRVYWREVSLDALGRYIHDPPPPAEESPPIERIELPSLFPPGAAVAAPAIHV